MLIFDGFGSAERAESFAAYVQAEFGKEATVCASQEESDEIDQFPFPLTPPIVLTERALGDFDLERAIESSVTQFGGRFAGT